MKQAFEKLCEQYDQESRKFITDVGHKWDFTYLLLKLCIEYEHLIIEFYKNDPTFRKILFSMELKFRKYWKDLPMLFSSQAQWT